jgi:polyphosphate kinase
MKQLNLFQINTTAWEEEDFLLQTTLTEEEIVKVITPIVMDEREKDISYDNDYLVIALQKAYPNDAVAHYVPSQIDLISI